MFNNSINRVVITGVGVITPIGINKEEYWNNLINGKSGITKIEKFEVSSFPSQIAAQVNNFVPEKYLSGKEIRRTDRFIHFAVAATYEAIQDSGLNLNEENMEEVGVYIGSGIGGLSSIEEEHKLLLNKGVKNVSPFLVPKMIANMAAGYVAIKLNAKGPSSATTTACSASAHAIGDAFRLIQYNKAKIMITGGSEACITPLALAGFGNMHALSTKYNDTPSAASRPFDKKRDGFVIGEGSGILILEELKHALNRGAHIYAEIVGYGQSNDAYHVTAPEPTATSQSRAIANALKEAQIEPSQVDYINAHGTSTQLNDKCETLAIKKIFKEHAYSVPISSTKSMIGHLLGAAAAVELIACCLTIERRKIHPTINYEEKDPDCDLYYVPNVAIDKEVNVAISNSFGFGGHNVCLVIKKLKI